jgi:hypothetical protein
MAPSSAQPPSRFASLLVWAMPISLGLLVAAVSTLEVLVPDPMRTLVASGDSRRMPGFASFYQVVFVIGFASLIGARLSRPLTIWSAALLPVALALFTFFHLLGGFAGFLQLGTLIGFGLVLTLVGILLLPFAAAAPGVVYALFLISSSFIANAEREDTGLIDLRRVFGYSAVAAVIYSWCTTLMPSLRDGNVPSIEAFALYCIGVVLSGFFLCSAAWYAAGWQQLPRRMLGNAALCIAVVFALSIGLIETYRQTPGSVLPGQPPILGQLRDNIRLRRATIDEPLRVGHLELRLPELRGRASGVIAIERTTRELQSARWKSPEGRLNAIPNIELRQFVGHGWERELLCSPADDRGIAACRVLGHPTAGVPLNDAGIVRPIWTNAHIVELNEDRGPTYLAVQERDGRPSSCRILLQNFPANGYVVEAALDCAHRQQWPELAAQLRAHLTDHLVKP